MKRFYNTVIQELHLWAKKKEVLPPHSEEIKLKVLQQLPPSSKMLLQRPMRFSWMMIGVPAACLLLYIGIHLLPQRNRTEQFAYVGGGPDAPLSLSPLNNESGRSYTDDDPLGIEDFSGSSNLSSMSRDSDIFDRVKDRMRTITAKSNPIDTREYMQTGYGATFYTRHVERMGERIQFLVRGYGGRVNDVSLSPERGHVSFVVPKTSLALFRYELQEFAPGARFIVETENSKNALPQKQRIETDATSAQVLIAQAERDKERRSNEYTKKQMLLQGEVARYASILASLKNQVPTSTTHREWLQKEINRMTVEHRVRLVRLENEKKNYEQFIETQNTIITSSELSLKRLAEETDALMYSVDTVNGYISIKHITIFQIVDLFVPLKGVVILLGMLIIMGYFLGGRRKELEIP